MNPNGTKPASPPPDTNSGFNGYNADERVSKKPKLNQATSSGNKKPREQYSCVECFRRKQKCDRKFPCNNCIQRRLPERCLPPTSVGTPSQVPSIALPSLDAPPPTTYQSRPVYSTTYSGQSQAGNQFKEPHHTPSLSAGPSFNPSDRSLAETTARLARLERLLSLQDHSYAEKRLRLAEEAVLELLAVDNVVSNPDEAHGPESGRPRAPGHMEQQKTGQGASYPQDNSYSHSDYPHVSTGPPLTGYSGAAAYYQEAESSSAHHHLGIQQDSSDGENESNVVEVLGDNGYNGATALAILSRAPVLGQVQTSSARNSYDDRSFLSIKNHLSGVSSSLDSLLDLTHFSANEIRALFAVLPGRDVCDKFVENYWREWDWTRSPLPPNVFPTDWHSWCTPDTFLVRHGKMLNEQGSNMMASLALVLSVLALGSVNPTLSSQDGHAMSSAIFWAALKALAYCQSPGSNDSKTMWARSILMRYGDLIRNTQMQWYMKSSWIANALDQGFHRDGAGFGLNAEATAEGRVLWSHVVHSDREWALVLGRPLGITQYSTRMPTEQDLAPWSWDYQQYILRRNELTEILGRISTLFQELSLKRTPEAHNQGNYAYTDAHNDPSYKALLAIDRDLDYYLENLPPWFSLDPMKTNHAMEQNYPHLKVYRQIIIAQVSFVRITMHRPFMLKALRKKKHPYRYSWQRCVDTAVQDLRARKMWNRTFSPPEQRQMFIGAWALFNSAVVLGLSILISVDMAEMPNPDTYQEYIGHLQDCLETMQTDLEQGRDDAVSRRERRIMDSLLARLDACTNAREDTHGPSPRLSLTSRSATHTPAVDMPFPPSQPDPAPAIQFDPFLLQPFTQQAGLPIDGALLTDNQAFFNWEGLFSQMYYNDPIFP